jgi:hypothetical protein
VQQTASLFDGLGSVHNSRQRYREGRASADLAVNSDIPTHHLAEPPADGEAKTGAAIAVLEEACENSWNSLSICSGVMPKPVSATAIVIQSRPFSRSRHASILIAPRSVNLFAFLMR